jgi:hypothetical protein
VDMRGQIGPAESSSRAGILGVDLHDAPAPDGLSTRSGCSLVFTLGTAHRDPLFRQAESSLRVSSLSALHLQFQVPDHRCALVWRQMLRIGNLDEIPVSGLVEGGLIEGWATRG